MTVQVERRSRRWRRHPIDVPIRVIVHRSSKTSVFPGRGNELSEGGMALTAGVELNPGDETEVEFTPPYSGPPIRIRGMLRNRAGYRYGIEFLAGSDREAEQVDHLRTMLSVMSSAL
jgi:PilZ domain